MSAVFFSHPDKLPSVKLEKGDTVGYYDPSRVLIVISPDAANDPSLVLREFMHSVLDKQQDAGRLSEDRRQALLPFESLMAFCIPASFLNNPKIGNSSMKGEPKDYIYDLQGPSDLRDYDKPEQYEKPYGGAEMLRRVFWDIRQAVGRDTADKFVVGAWQEFSRSSSTQSAKEFLTIFERQFEQGAGSKQLLELNEYTRRTICSCRLNMDGS